jgi:thioredoxin-related protein
MLRVDILNPLGREFARRHDFSGTPTFVLFDGHGTEIRRWQRPPSLSELE